MKVIREEDVNSYPSYPQLPIIGKDFAAPAICLPSIKSTKASTTALSSSGSKLNTSGTWAVV
jgi:hypothetical protein